jgi:hypothetical protein
MGYFPSDRYPTPRSLAELESYASKIDVAIGKMRAAIEVVEQAEQPSLTAFEESEHDSHNGPSVDYHSCAGHLRMNLISQTQTVAWFIAHHAQSLLAPPFHVEIPGEELSRKASGVDFSAIRFLDRVKSEYGTGAGRDAACAKAAEILWKHLLKSHRREAGPFREPKVTKSGITFEIWVVQDQFNSKNEFKYAYGSREKFGEVAEALGAFGAWAHIDEAGEWKTEFKNLENNKWVGGTPVYATRSCRMGSLKVAFYRQTVKLTFNHSVAAQFQEFLGLFRAEDRAA